ncbi:MAG: ElyC/SanA/YdcF family protein [Candidatus Pacebacteria bacterium]|nr:ElyC/SanA/YdcF family protein [Candidatus Paceibacterota bacterium]
MFPARLAVIVQAGDDSRLELALKTIKKLGPNKDPLLIVSGGSSNNQTLLARMKEHPFSFAPDLAKMVPSIYKKLGIKEPKVIVEPHASNTKECAQLVLPILFSSRISAAIIAMTPQHMLRSLLTFRKWFDGHGGQSIVLLTAVSDLGRITSPEMQEDIDGELDRIVRYSKQGDCYPDMKTAVEENPEVWTLF